MFGKDGLDPRLIAVLEDMRKDLKNQSLVIEELKKTFSSVRHDIEDLKSKVRSLEAELNQLRTEVEVMKKSTDSELLRRSVIPSLTNRVETLEAKVKELEKKAENPKSVQLVILPKDEAKRLIDSLIGD